MLRALSGLALVVAAIIGIGLQGSSAATAGTAAIGLFTSSQTPSNVLALGSQLGVKPTVITAYAGGTDSTTFPSWAVGSLRMSIAVGNLTTAQATTIGGDLVANGQADADIRIMWEQNGNWFPWGTQALTSAEFISDWDSIVAAFRAVPGNDFSYTWDINAGGSNEFATWPGASEVTNVGFDHYDTNGGVSADASIVNPILAFAKAQGKPVEIDEWGLNGKDDPAFINYMASVINNPANDVVMQSYFNDFGPNGDDQLQDFPSSKAAYTADFEGTTSPTTTAPVPSTSVPATTVPPWSATTTTTAPPSTTTTTRAPATTTTTRAPATTTTEPSSVTTPFATPGSPSAPTDLTASTTGSTVTLSWANAPNTLGDDIFADGTEIAWPGWPSAPVTKYTVTNVPTGTHTYYVAAYNSSGVGAKSATVAVTVTVGSSGHWSHRGG